MPRNTKVTVNRTAPSANAKGIPMTVIQRHQTPQEHQRFSAAADALLRELVRHEFDRHENRNGAKGN